jgi:hypothetical protein
VPIPLLPLQPNAKNYVCLFSLSFSDYSFFVPFNPANLNGLRLPQHKHTLALLQYRVHNKLSIYQDALCEVFGIRKIFFPGLTFMTLPIAPNAM